MIKGLFLLSAASILLANISTVFAEGIAHTPRPCESEFKDQPQGFEKKLNIIAIRDLKNEKDEEIVRVKGKVTKYFGDYKYEFTDENGDTIEIELNKDKDWSFIRKDETIEVIAQYDKEFFSADSLDVKCALPPEHPMTQIGIRIPPKTNRRL